MKRRDFFTKLGLGAVAAVVAPQLVKADEEKQLYILDIESGEVTKVNHAPPEWAKGYRQYPLTYDEAYDVEFNSRAIQELYEAHRKGFDFFDWFKPLHS